MPGEKINVVPICFGGRARRIMRARQKATRDECRGNGRVESPAAARGDFQRPPDDTVRVLVNADRLYMCLPVGALHVSIHFVERHQSMHALNFGEGCVDRRMT